MELYPVLVVDPKGGNCLFPCLSVNHRSVNHRVLDDYSTLSPYLAYFLQPVHGGHQPMDPY
jgi:hypothetical protein